MYIDASALVAIIAGESDGEDLRRRLKKRKKRSISALSEFEAALALARIRNISVVAALDLVTRFKKIYAITGVDIEPRFSELAIRNWWLLYLYF